MLIHEEEKNDVWCQQMAENAKEENNNVRIKNTIKEKKQKKSPKPIPCSTNIVNKSIERVNDLTKVQSIKHFFVS